MPGLSSELLLDALSDMSSLQELEIQREPVLATGAADPGFLAHLIPPADGLDSVLCPRLRDLKLLSFSAVSDETLLKVIRARTTFCPQNITHLSHVDATLQRAMQLDVILHLQDAITEGLEINLKYLSVLGVKYSPLEGTDRGAEMLLVVS
ncbi:hypothetical protein C8R44DRAFT_873488 [Mycena epipterygia]|nr:hypothetical protein C8R44DRAFT_873488 [Mycena epipterygia]